MISSTDLLRRWSNGYDFSLPFLKMKADYPGSKSRGYCFASKVPAGAFLIIFMRLLAFYRRYEKTALLFLVVIVWALCYFSINSFSEGRTTHILGLGFEESIPFIPFFVIFYIITYPVVIMPYFVVKDIKDYRRTVLAYLFLIFISSVVYIMYPVKTIRPEIIEGGIFLNIVNLVYKIAKPYNLFPSLHVSLSTLSSLVCLEYNKKVGYFLAVLLFLISLSTLFVKQHYLVDIIFAAILAFFSYYLFLFILKDKIF